MGFEVAPKSVVLWKVPQSGAGQVLSLGLEMLDNGCSRSCRGKLKISATHLD